MHELQVLPSGEIPTAAHDFHLDLVATPERVVRCPRRGGRARAALRWDELKPEKIASIPLLARLAREGQPS